MLDAIASHISPDPGLAARQVVGPAELFAAAAAFGWLSGPHPDDRHLQPVVPDGTGRAR